MAQPRMDVSLGEGGATLTLLPGSGAEGAVTLTLNQIGELIAALGAARARLVSALPPDAKERRLEGKSQRAGIKRLRGRPDGD